MQAVGFAILTPLLVILFRRGDDGMARDPRWLRTATIVMVFSVAVLAIFAQSRYPILFLIPLGFMLVAYTVDLRAVAISVLLCVIIAVGMTVAGRGPIQLVRGDIAERIQVLQAFIAIMTATTLPIAALMAEHARLKQSLITARTDAESANRAKSVFLATISHEIRTPLNGVLGMAHIMGMDHLSDAQSERLGVMRRSGEALLSLLNDVLDLSKIEAGKLTFEAIDFDLGDVLRSVIGGFEELAQGKDVALSLTMDTAEGIYRGDPLRVRQIAYNLISNALKFTDSGAISVCVRQDATGLNLAVSDTGIGIPADKLGALFSKFNQVDESTTRRFGGTGLGLSICRELAVMMGGHIHAQSQDGQGSTFTVFLPLPRVGDSGAVTVAAPMIEQAVVQPGLRVLAAEDNATNQLVLRTLLELNGVEVVIVESGLEAIAAWQDADWDVILMDVQMPIMDGPTATREIRRLEAELGRKRTPIIALTANTLSHHIDQYLEAGMDSHLAKPINVAALMRVLADPYGAGGLHCADQTSRAPRRAAFH